MIVKDEAHVVRCCLDSMGPMSDGCMFIAPSTKSAFLDIAVLPEYRGAHVASRLIADLQAEASATGAPLRLEVAVDNPAARLYQRLGFNIVGERSTNFAMEWRAAPDSGAVGPQSS